MDKLPGVAAGTECIRSQYISLRIGSESEGMSQKAAKISGPQTMMIMEMIVRKIQLTPSCLHIRR